MSITARRPHAGSGLGLFIGALRGLLVALTALLLALTTSRADDWTECANADEWEKAIAACNRLIAQGGLSRSKLATAYSNRGAAYLNQGEYDLALADLNRSVRLDPDAALTYYNRGATHFFVKDYRKAISDLTRALRLNESHPDSYLYRGRSYLELDEYDAAIRDLTAALRLEPAAANYHRYRGDALLGNGDFVAAIADYDRFLARHPQDVRTLNNRAHALLKLKRFIEAISDVDHALTLAPDYDTALTTRGEILDAIGRPREALAMYERALTLNPDHAAAKEGRGRVAGVQQQAPAVGAGDRSPADRSAPKGLTPEQADNRAKLIALQEAYNSTGFHLLMEIAKGDGAAAKNLAISPFSIGSAMAMALVGASGETEREMRQALRHRLAGRDIAETHALARRLLQAKPPAQGPLSDGAKGGFELKIANALALGPTGGQVAPDYTADLVVNFGAQLLSDATLSSINQWVGERTDGRIRTILDRLPAKFSLVLLNAVAMKAAWATPFDPGGTRDAAFTLASGRQAAVPMMHKEGDFAVLEAPGLRAVRLPYADPMVGMVIIIADRADRFSGPQLGLDPQDLEAVFSKLPDARPQRVQLALPRFTVSFGTDLVEVFKRLGMHRPFDARSAEFTRMARTAGDRFFIDQIAHRVKIDVDELGTEAAAATAVVVAPGAGKQDPDKRPLQFIVDRPFVFFVYDLRNGSVLFAGRVTDPRAN
jgi:serine protease inhibitor/Tfp pilus assembly protein PilF